MVPYSQLLGKRKASMTLVSKKRKKAGPGEAKRQRGTLWSRNGMGEKRITSRGDYQKERGMCFGSGTHGNGGRREEESGKNRVKVKGFS